MTEKVKMMKPKIKRLSMEERYDRACDFFEMDHLISLHTHKKNGTLQAWVDDTVEAYGASVPRFLGPMVKQFTKLAPNMALKKTFEQVFMLDQQHHELEEFSFSEPKDGTIVVRWDNCARYKRHKKLIKMLGYDYDDRIVCEVEKMHLTHPKHPGCQMGFIPTKIEWTEDGCQWHYKKV